MAQKADEPKLVGSGVKLMIVCAGVQGHQRCGAKRSSFWASHNMLLAPAA